MNYVLDTNVVSELMRSDPDENVHAWFVRQVVGQLFIATTTLNEISFGICCLPFGRRRRQLEAVFRDLVVRRFAERIVSIGEAEALACGVLRARAQARGRPAGFADAEIAAVALTHFMTVATHDTRDFAVFGVPLVDPFDPKAVA